MADPITLDFFAGQQRTILDEIAANRSQTAAMRADIQLIKDDITVLSAMAMRQDRATKTLIDMVHTLTDQQNRFAERLSRIAEPQGA